MSERTQAEIAKMLGMSEEEFRREMAMARWMNDPAVKEALHRQPVVRQEDIDALADFTRVLKEQGMLDATGHVKRDA